ncbi:MAG: hypothetical protein N2489_07865 [Clostridia bacterium]|nr:hypothetical protein [Clostridia bacterium]
MGENLLYRKVFLIMEQEDAGYGSGQEPTGYMKIEVKDGKGKLSIQVQNLKDNHGYVIYKAYILKCSGDKVFPVEVGNIAVHRNRGELQWEFEPDNVASTGYCIDDFNVATILAEFTDRNKGKISCPLVAYRDKHVKWKDRLKDALYTQVSSKTCENDKVIKKHDIYSRYSGSVLESIYKQKTEQTEPEPAAEAQTMKMENDKLKEAMENNEAIDLPTDKEELTDKNSYIHNDDYIKDPENMINTAKALPNESKINEAQNKQENERSLERLAAELDRYFEIYDPFSIRRRDYKWWKANSPVHLNNVLYQCNIKTPVMFNPKILSAHFKYRHLIFGIYSDKIRRKDYLVFGVPGVYSIDDRPFGEMCRWAQVEGSRPRYGAFGYWLIYIDPDNGRIV